MNTRIRHVSHKRKGLVVQNELVIDKQTINIGRATDQDIFLSDLGVAYRHARLTLAANGQIGVTSLTSSGIYVNGRFAQSGSIKGSGVVQVGPYSITIERNKDGYDYDITIEQIAQDVVEIQSGQLPAMSLEETWLSRRRGAWVFFLLILIAFLALPIAGYFDRGLGELERHSALLPDDGVWLSGDISAPHKHFAEQCDNCHQKAFQTVQDETCVTCHASTTVHADPELFDLHALQDVRCASCHKEHNGTDYLIRRDQKLCSDCHKDLSQRVETDLDNISDFSGQHPEFRPKLRVQVSDAAAEKPNMLEWQRVSLKRADIRHETGLKFPHDIHMDVNGLESPTGNRTLECSSCHQTDASGSYMLPLEFEQHCQECHQLTFDENSPDRELPHSNLQAMSSTLDEYYAFMALRGNYSDDDASTPALITRRRIPGKVLTPAERKTALAWAQEKAADVKEEMIEFRACGLCHKVVRDTAEPVGWKVPDVQISQRWFTKGAFDHASHQASECADCHQATLSKHSEDVLLPGIKVCRDCHGGQADEDKLDSGCVSCHVFHTPDAVLLGRTPDRSTE